MQSCVWRVAGGGASTESYRVRGWSHGVEAARRRRDRTDERAARLQSVIGVVERRQIMPVLANVLLSAWDERLSITGTDLEVESVRQREDRHFPATVAAAASSTHQLWM
ncbi:MAG: hypothetical protein IRZ28_17480 [Steroidobacteraceae bacterium]|nr:hypothetical protein [Steroidobacteraceae bacterium]